MTFFAVDFHSRSGNLIFEIKTGKFAVFGKFADIEINAIACFVTIALFHQFFDIFDHILNVVGGFGYYFGLADIEKGNVLHKHVRVKLGDFPRRFFLLAAGFFHFVFAFVAVRQKMPHVRNVHDAFDFISVVTQNSSHFVHKNIRS